MRAVVVDASVAVKWFVPEARAEAAARLLDGSFDLMAPDLLMPEVANILWKKVRRRELSRAEAREILAALIRVPLDLVPSAQLLEAALEVSLEYGRSVYDSLYVALAVARDCSVVTADDRLVKALGGGALKAHVRGLGA